MSDQPWRNPRPAPHLPEVQPRLTQFLIPSWLRAWWPALLWAAFIFTMSTDTFSAQHTASFFWPIVRWFKPDVTAHQFEVIHHYIRKTAHFTEYFVFCMLLYRGIRGARISSRQASPYDSLLDSVGAFFAFAVLYLWLRSRRPAQTTA